MAQQPGDKMSDPVDDPAERYLAAFAEIAVVVGMNVQPGQVVGITTEPGMEAVMRAIADRAYAAGALYVDPWTFDVYVKRSRLLHADAATLDWVPPWIGDRHRAIAALHGAALTLRGPVAPHLMDDIDPVRAGRDRLPRVPDTLPLVNARAYNWSILPAPTPGWAAALFPDLTEQAAYARLWDEIAHILRLDEDDPAAAWDTRLTELESRARRLDALALDTLRFSGPGTDLTVGLLPGSVWAGGRKATSFGVVHTSNLPTEEVFTAPDPERVDGVVTATKPLFASGSRVEGLRVRFAGGRAVDVHADHGGGIVEGLIAHDDGAARLGEVALVDRSSRVGRSGTVYYETLLDENAASHIALGNAYEVNAATPDDVARLNRSAIHTDFMIGSDEVDVTGVLRDGSEVPLLRGGRWQLPSA